LENHPQVVAAIAAERPLLGNSPEVLQRVRDPFFVRNVLLAGELPALELCPYNKPPPTDGRWMFRTFRGSAGTGIRLWNPETAERLRPTPEHFFQERCGGVPVSALFLALPGKTRLIGISRQFVGLPALNAPEFAYCGSVGPIELGELAHNQIRRTGEVLAAACRLRGLFGCDFLWDEKAAWLTEINPRYTASVEIYEHALGQPLFDWHCRACLAFNESTSGSSTGALCDEMQDSLQTGRRQVVGKMILYAPAGFRTSSLDRFRERNRTQRLPMIADVPAAGTQIGRGEPVCTVFAAASDVDGCCVGLAEHVREVASALDAGGAGCWKAHAGAGSLPGADA
jgi:predicted ATP-grasp superfamily ATP-dependent carboligase